MAKLESLLQAIESGDGKTVRDFMLAFPFETQLSIARRLQTLNLRRRKESGHSSSMAPTIYAQFEMIEASGCMQEKLTIRVLQAGQADDVYMVQRNSETGRILIRFQFAPSRVRNNGTPLSLSRIEMHQSNDSGAYAFNPGPDGFGALTPLNMVG